ncbi:MAG: cobalamin biosynthesis protein CbiD [Clostridium sp.]|nr:cobalamin biosynthesis protein CbiD [Clostridium sp.]
MKTELPTYAQPDGTILKAGFTSGTCAAAAAKAAVNLLFAGSETDKFVTVEIPAGLTLTLPLALLEKAGETARAGVVKDAGDDPDITNGIMMVAEARKLNSPGICLLGGEGVGRVTKPGLAVPPGQYAINPVPRSQILAHVQSVLPPNCGVAVTISVPGGEQLARRTLNPELGIIGGISILGTTGLVEPMSVDACKRSLVPQIDVALAAGERRLVLTPGKMGRRNALSCLPVKADAVLITSNFIGYMLHACAVKGVDAVLLFGHLGKIIKLAAGITDTHSSVADGRREVLAAHAALLGLPAEAITALMKHNTAEESSAYLLANGWRNVLAAVASEVSRRAERMAGGNLRVGCMLLNLAGELLAIDDYGKTWLEENDEI